MHQHMSPGWQSLTKHAKYGDLCTARGIQHLPAAFSTYGGWGEGILNKLVEPFFNRLRAEEWAATGGTEWRTLAKREFFCSSAQVWQLQEEAQ